MKNIILDEVKGLIQNENIGDALQKLSGFVEEQRQEMYNVLSIQQRYYNDYLNRIDDLSMSEEIHSQIKTNLCHSLLKIVNNIEEATEKVAEPSIAPMPNKFDIDYVLPEHSTVFIIIDADTPTTAEDLISTVYHDESFQEAQVLIVNVEQYAYFDEFLTDLQANHLEGYPINAYGKDWVVGNHTRFFKSFVLPHQWLASQDEEEANAENEKPEEEGQVKAMATEEETGELLEANTEDNPLVDARLHIPFKDTGIHIKFKSYYDWCECNFWGVVNSGFETAYGLFTSDEAVFQDIFSGEFSSKLTGEFFSLIQKNAPDLPYKKYSEVNPDDYKYKLIIQPYQPLDNVPNKSVFIL
ncbi:hypothetical protein [Microscilla marina]|uniref:Effector-associated domain-containing protein n=1 Tax=Microscilla marina ATCC 23134 TaxID=313606 RepID=A1ZGF0_MICM2|nr:hypothetical protein [Microscilla marina]EAY30567.1 hypothetical protein M23134_03205 [Microscilla marina ATCC 23134]